MSKKNYQFYVVTYLIKWVTTSWTDVTTICPRNSDPSWIVSYYMKLVATSWTHSMKIAQDVLYIMLTLYFGFLNCQSYAYLM